MTMPWLVVTALLLLSAAVVARLGLPAWALRRPAAAPAQLPWRKLSATPLAEKRYTPQGLTWAAGRLVFANSWKNTRSRVYEIDPQSMVVLRTFDMPPPAVHTSGLAWDGQCLWAVDFKSNCCYRIDYEASFRAGRAVVSGQFDTTLAGASACCLAPYGDETRLVISDFMHTRRSYFVDIQRALRHGTARGAIDFSYRNGGFSQGLEFAAGWLWESENRRGVDVVLQIDPQRLLLTADSRRAAVRQYDAPSRGVEDLAWDGSQLWTSDEVDFHFYRADLPADSPLPRP